MSILTVFLLKYFKHFTTFYLLFIFLFYFPALFSLFFPFFSQLSLETLETWPFGHNRLFWFQQVRKVVRQQFFASISISSRPLDPYIWSELSSNHFQSSIALQCSPFRFPFPQLQSCFEQTWKAKVGETIVSIWLRKKEVLFFLALWTSLKNYHLVLWILAPLCWGENVRSRLYHPSKGQLHKSKTVQPQF